MNAELEAIILAYDAWMSARGMAADNAKAIFEARLDEVIARQPNLSRATLEKAIRAKYVAWLRAQGKNPSALPPTA